MTTTHMTIDYGNGPPHPLARRVYMIACDLRADTDIDNREAGHYLDAWHKYGGTKTAAEIRQMASTVHGGARKRLRLLADAIDQMGH